MEAEILATGSELLTPDRVDTNSLWLTARLGEVGVEVRRKTQVGDDLDRMREALEDALRRSSLVICTGGLGPTEDDVTRAAAAAATGRPLRPVPALEERLRQRFAGRGLEMPANNLRQALVPEGGEPLENRVGTAPGIRLRLEDRLLILLPGPPREMKPMVEEYLLPELREAAGGVRVVRRLLKVTGLTESGMDARIAPRVREFPTVAVTVNFTPVDLEIRLSARGREGEPEAALEALTASLRAELGEALFSEEGEGLEAVVGRLLAARGLDLAVAEVGSEGLVASRLMEVRAPLRVGLVAGGEGAGLPGFVPWPATGEAAADAVRDLRARTGAAVALVVGAARGSGEQAVVPVALDLAGSLHGDEVPVPAARDLRARRASQSALDRVRRSLLAGS